MSHFECESKLESELAKIITDNFGLERLAMNCEAWQLSRRRCCSRINRNENDDEASLAENNDGSRSSCLEAGDCSIIYRMPME